ncbi:MAG TPA: hypothetical protein VFB00_04935 [Terriglobales bacterium]|nr:hypothetical protein [Terriglobales bacterium]
MTPAHTSGSEFRAPEVVTTIHQRSLGVGIIFGVVSLIAAVLPGTRQQFFHSYLLGYMLWLGVTLGSMAILMIQHMTGGMWGMVIRRQLEAAMRTLPVMALFFIPILVGMPHLYGAWMNPDPNNKHLVQLHHEYLMRWGTAQFLFLDGFIGRAIVYFLVWLLFAYGLNRLSVRQDQPPVENLAPRFRRISAPGLILYAFTISFAVIDWVMSLSPPWISTIYGFIFIAGELLSAISLMVVVERILMNYEPGSYLIKPKEVHDHGKLMLTFVLLWAYFSFSQLLIIWSGNLPSEIRFFTRRMYSGWQGIALALVVFHFAVPFLLLLSRPFKRHAQMLVWLASALIVMRFIDLYWYIEPNFHEKVFISWQDLVVPTAIGGFWLALFFHNLRSRPLLPAYDLHAQEFLEYAGVVHD